MKIHCGVESAAAEKLIGRITRVKIEIEQWRYIAGWSSWELVGLITRRSQVRVLSPLLKRKAQLRKWQRFSFLPHFHSVSRSSWKRFSFSVRSRTRMKKITKWTELFLVKHPIRSIRNEVKDIPVHFQKRMEMQKESAFSAWLYLVKPLHLLPSYMKWRIIVSQIPKSL